MKLIQRRNNANNSKESVCFRLGVMILASAVAAPSWAQQNTDEEAVEEIVVRGIRGSLQQALGIKRNADNCAFRRSRSVIPIHAGH